MNDQNQRQDPAQPQQVDQKTETQPQPTQNAAADQPADPTWSGKVQDAPQEVQDAGAGKAPTDNEPEELPQSGTVENK